MIDEEASVEVKDVPEFSVAFIRHVGPYKGQPGVFQSLFERLFLWAGPRGLARCTDSQCLTIYHHQSDSPGPDTPAMDACITVSSDTEVEGEVGKAVVAGGKYAVGHFEISVDEYEWAWETVMGEWLSSSGYHRAEGPCFERYLNDPNEHPQGKHVVEIYIPVDTH